MLNICHGFILRLRVLSKEEFEKGYTELCSFLLPVRRYKYWTQHSVLSPLTMTDIIQNVFNEISLERDPRLWHSYRDDETMLERRIQFLSEFPQTLFSKVLSCFVDIRNHFYELLCRILMSPKHPPGRMMRLEQLC